MNANRGRGEFGCDRQVPGRGLGVERWKGVRTIAVTSRSPYSSAASVKQSNEEDHTEGVPTSSIGDRRVVVGWGPNEKSQLYVASASLVYGC